MLILIKELPSYIVFSKGIDSFDIKKIENSLFENDSQNNDLIKDNVDEVNDILEPETVENEIQEVSNNVEEIYTDYRKVLKGSFKQYEKSNFLNYMFI